MESIKQQILDYLKSKGDQYTFGGVIEDHIRQTNGSKASNCSRRCRELVNEGLIERKLAKVQGSNLNVVMYRVSTTNNIPVNPASTFHENHPNLEKKYLDYLYG